MDTDHFGMTKLSENEVSFQKIAALLRRWVEELPGKNFEERPSPCNPRRDLRNILGYVKPQADPWIEMSRETVDGVRMGMYRLGDMILHPFPNTPGVRLWVQIANEQLADLNTIKPIVTTKSRDELIRQDVMEDDVHVWIHFAELLRQEGIQVGTKSDAAGWQPSSKVPEFSDITTTEWKPDEKEMQTVRMAARNAGRMAIRNDIRLPFWNPVEPWPLEQCFVVVGLKTVRGYLIEDEDLARILRDPVDAGGVRAGSESRQTSKMPEGLIIAYKLRKISHPRDQSFGYDSPVD
ncbi:hypothetical protein Neosp_004436 [[Neocosmospora] mangrovei]